MAFLTSQPQPLEELGQSDAVVAAQAVNSVEHRVEKAGLDVADIYARLFDDLFLTLARGLAQFAEPGRDPVDDLVIADVFLIHGQRLFQRRDGLRVLRSIRDFRTAPQRRFPAAEREERKIHAGLRRRGRRAHGASRS